MNENQKNTFRQWIAVRENMTPMTTQMGQMGQQGQNTMTNVQGMFTALTQKMQTNPGDMTIKQDVQKLMPMLTKWQQELNAPPKPGQPQQQQQPQPQQVQQPQQGLQQPQQPVRPGLQQPQQPMR